MEGRYDDHNHYLTDVESQVWVGKDYYNTDICGLSHLDKPYEDLLKRTKDPRLPWHDVSCRLEGPSVTDVVDCYIQRWNFVTRLL